MVKRVIGGCLVLMLMGVLSGCASYYRIVDPISQKVYFTQDIDNKGNGVIQFKDEASQSLVTLPQSEVIEISKDQYKADAKQK